MHVTGLSQERVLRIERDILSKNNDHAAANRVRLAKRRSFALNFVSSPGSGKTSLLARAIGDLKERFPIAVKYVWISECLDFHACTTRNRQV